MPCREESKSECYNKRGLVCQYKAHVLSIVEGSIGAIYHASTSLLRKVEGVQASFLHAIGLSASEAFLVYNLAPLQLRRDIAILGVLFEVANGLAHPEFAALFPFDVRMRSWHTRLDESRHNKQLLDLCNDSYSEMMNRSIFKC